MKKSYRIKKESDFQNIINEKNSFANRNFVVYVSKQDNSRHFKVGLSVGKKIGNAVTRNRYKRLIRQALLSIQKDIPPNYYFIVIARPNIVSLSYDEVKKNLIHVLRLANILI
ncbi:ribonuclease P protein component [Vagococcus acidifermentans]|uniref:Ribonuclease P protein component n=1 Tax=Vagococcus acidifermentans TaxID=564710 RepID=A0A430AMR9_9ENTE|nr:ribonuclease P protein component [Vagococcus acidifermentans]RSU09389.1 ribonuclease P protein component [Vagococcus acidifermentans]